MNRVLVDLSHRAGAGLGAADEGRTVRAEAAEGTGCPVLAKEAPDAEEQALAERVYEGIAQVIEGVEPGTLDGAPIPEIVIDDKIGPPTGTEGPTTPRPAPPYVARAEVRGRSAALAV
ncbi:hypothetical protein [Actinoallomurus rhizosphaericola]|uniref:hypothetical protein n=1 Tax=Actinoallomurus rhizosphaericola TaxID=2952536 RepID=UPI002093BD7D|nr:hypothetical protein [Actinoallomurus rhizosphaericola]MCO6000209.1 hypothetical protein [Actinoallomurus rhizosphaericola]